MSDPLSNNLKSGDDNIWEDPLFGGTPEKSSPSTPSKKTSVRLDGGVPPRPLSTGGEDTKFHVDNLDETGEQTEVDVEDDNNRKAEDDNRIHILNVGDPLLPGAAGLTDAEAVERRKLLKQLCMLRRSVGSHVACVPSQLPSYPGEVIVLEVRKGDCYFLHYEGAAPLQGALYVSTYQLSFFPSQHNSMPWDFFHVPLATIARVTTGASRKGGIDDKVTIACKDGRTLSFVFTNIQAPYSSSDCQKFITILRTYSFTKLELLFAFEHAKAVEKQRRGGKIPDVEGQTGWGIFDAVSEYTRLGLLGYNRSGTPSNWRKTDINKDYSISDNYPSVIIIPNSIDDATMIKCASFRSKGRMPACVWIHPTNGATILRSSQPKVGVGIDGGARNREPADEQVVAAMWSANTNINKGPLIIADCRPKTNAFANRAQGLGYEGEHYTNMELIFLNIHNIHVMRDSNNRLVDKCMSRDTTETWGAQVEGTDWLQHIRTVLDSALNMAKSVSQGRTVFVHCSDGWDRTAQLCGLMQILLDPYYRTYRGIQVLISKEWLSFGHRFQERIGHGDINADDNHRSPIFIQFLDCISQLLKIYPRAFEYSPAILVEIANHLYSCKYGTFLGNCERERIEISKKTESLWTHLDNNQRRFGNPLYLPHDLLLPHNSVVLRNVTLWNDYFLRFSPTRSVVPSSAPSMLPKLGPIVATTSTGEKFLFDTRQNTIAAHSVGVPLSTGTAQSDDEWTFRTLLNELAKAKSFEEKNCRSPAEMLKITKYEDMEVIVSDIKSEKASLESTIEKLKSEIISVKEAAAKEFDAERKALKKQILQLQTENQNLKEESGTKASSLWDDDDTPKPKKGAATSAAKSTSKASSSDSLWS